MNQQNPTLKKAMLEALEKSLGVVTTAAKKVGINRSTHYEWLKTDEDYRKSVEALSDVAVDFAESTLYKLIESGDTTATIFYLKTKGKSRGYIEKFEANMNHSGGVTVISRPVSYENKQHEVL